MIRSGIRAQLGAGAAAQVGQIESARGDCFDKHPSAREAEAGLIQLRKKCEATSRPRCGGDCITRLSRKREEIDVTTRDMANERREHGSSQDTQHV